MLSGCCEELTGPLKRQTCLSSVGKQRGLKGQAVRARAQQLGHLVCALNSEQRLKSIYVL